MNPTTEITSTTVPNFFYLQDEKTKFTEGLSLSISMTNSVGTEFFNKAFESCKDVRNFVNKYCVCDNEIDHRFKLQSLLKKDNEIGLLAINEGKYKLQIKKIEVFIKVSESFCSAKSEEFTKFSAEVRIKTFFLSIHTVGDQFTRGPTYDTETRISHYIGLRERATGLTYDITCLSQEPELKSEHPWNVLPISEEVNYRILSFHGFPMLVSPEEYNRVQENYSAQREILERSYYAQIRQEAKDDDFKS